MRRYPSSALAFFVTGAAVVVFVRSLARQIARESSAAFRTAAALIAVALTATAVWLLVATSRDRAAAEARLASAERAFAAQLRAASEAQLRADSVIVRLHRDFIAG